VSAIASLAEDRVVEGVYAVARKERRRTRGGSPYLALELVDPSGRIEARVWSDVELLDSRFGEGDAVKVLGRVERYRDKLQLEVRSLETRRRRIRPSWRPHCGETRPSWTGSWSFWRPRSRIRACARQRGDSWRTNPCGPRCAGCLRPRRTTPTRAAARAHGRGRDALPRGRAAPPAAPGDLVLAAALLHDVGRTAELERGPTFRATEEGRLLGHVHLGLRLVEERAAALETEVRAELLHAIAVHHDARGARTAEASVLYHANQLDATAATRPVE
jgi:3'-5' exoribonuclease